MARRIILPLVFALATVATSRAACWSELISLTVFPESQLLDWAIERR